MKVQDLQDRSRTTRTTSRTTRTTNRITRTTLRVVLVVLGGVLVGLEVVLVVLDQSWRSWTFTEASEVWVWVDWRPLKPDSSSRTLCSNDDKRRCLQGNPREFGAA